MMTDACKPVTTEELNAFVAALSATINAYYRAEYPTCELNWQVAFLDGQGAKFARVSVKSECGQHRGVHCFVELATGNILKAAGYKAPEKRNPRGNIRVGDGSNRWHNAFMEGCRHTSYLR